ncbi:MAG: hypothetical protein ABWX74_20160 [Aeromicrobium sp.]
MALSCLYLLIATNQPLGVNAYAPHDDTYFLRGAQAMVAGDWLGLFNQMTLIKGPGFTYFLAANHWTGLPVTLSLALVFLVSCLVLVHVLGRVGLAHPLVRLALLTALLLQPAVMPVQIIRDSLYHSLFLLVLAGMISLATDRGRGAAIRMACWGLVLGLFWITREEGIWIFPALAVLVSARLWQLRKDRSGRLPFVLAAAAYAVGAVVPTLVTSAINQREYDTFAVQDFKSKAFQGALESLDGIVVEPDVALAPVPNRALDLAYDASPAMRTIKPYLEGPETSGYLSMSCTAVPDACGSFIGGLWPWALRDAVAYAGRFTSQSDADAFFTRISSDIAKGCERGDFKCRSSVLPLVPVVPTSTLLDVPGSIWDAARLTAYGPGSYRPTAASAGSPEEIAQFTDFVGDPPRTASEAEGYSPTATGWSEVRHQLARVYSVVTPIVVLAGLVAFGTAVVRLLRRRDVGRPLLLVAAACWLLYLSRLSLVALIDVTSFPAIASSYLEPAYLVQFVAATTSLAALVSGLSADRVRTADREPTAAPAPDMSSTQADQGATS